jgi:hypothetical protein
MIKQNNIKTDVKTPIERGSIMILTMMAVLILSILVSGLLNVGTTEIYTTQNYQLQKSAYYMAVQGVEEVRSLIYNYPDAQSVTSIKRYSYGSNGPVLVGDDPSMGTMDDAEGLKKYYITGTLKDLETYNYGGSIDPTAISFIDQLKGFKAPPLPSISMGGSSSVAPVVWKVNVTAEVQLGSRKAYSEIISGVYSILTISY